ncbi:peptidase M50 [Chloroflexus islandicus]|uniref:Peptidase M50 n=1 Tax=Chloroflexus islandicus TaxID=1707952 RepID=A0A178M5W1_9CHLR|nr:site-2 protease family protein [Chloroflexus islandicus]OAN43303.1 peptidase M50 [Chloroflexus islandicus]
MFDFDSSTALRMLAAEVMLVNTSEELISNDQRAVRCRGQLLLEAQAAHDTIVARAQALGYTPLFQHDPAGAAILFIPTPPKAPPSRLWLAVLLFVLTIFSTMAVGGLQQNESTGQITVNWGHALSFSGSLLAILLAHELGHFFVARRERVAVSYPFFIPMPFFLLGTMGAFIAIKDLVPNRRALLAIGIAGPLAGLVVAIPVLMIGLSISEVKQVVPLPGSFTEGNSLLYAAIKILIFGRFLPSGGEDVYLHPMALAGWAGLLVTGLNLLPAGQLDGGHIFFALFGPRAARIMSMVVAVALLGLGFLWSGWFIWAVMIALIGQQRSPLRNEISPLTGPWRWLAWLGIVTFILVFTPVPLTVMNP